MEVLAAVGLASNILQFISFAQDLVSTTKQIWRNADGALTEHLELEAITTNLARLNSSLFVRSTHTTVDSAEDRKLRKISNVEDKELKELSEGCRSISGLLIQKLNSLKVTSKSTGQSARRWASFRQALNSVLSAEEILDLERRLNRFQRAVDSALLASLRYGLVCTIELWLTRVTENKSTKPRSTAKLS